LPLLRHLPSLLLTHLVELLVVPLCLRHLVLAPSLQGPCAIDIDLDVALDVLDPEDPVVDRAKDEVDILEEHGSLWDALASPRARLVV
jgi:hypothetical protein